MKLNWDGCRGAQMDKTTALENAVKDGQVCKCMTMSQ